MVLESLGAGVRGYELNEKRQDKGFFKGYHIKIRKEREKERKGQKETDPLMIGRTSNFGNS